MLVSVFSHCVCSYGLQRRSVMLLGEMAPTPAAAAAGRLSTESSPTCRCLFGRPSSDLVSAPPPHELHVHRDSSRRRWNFDFVTMLPLPAGRFEWTRCSDTPGAASTPTQPPVVATSPDYKTGARFDITLQIIDASRIVKKIRFVLLVVLNVLPGPQICM